MLAQPNQYPIIEIFDSIQGEGSWMGLPCTFIRFAGCNLRCSWCDTKSSWEKGHFMSIEEIISQVHTSRTILTGGEPGLQPLFPLLIALKQIPDMKIAIETNGTLTVPKEIDWVVCSPKPDAKYAINCIPNELKYVVDDQFSVDVIPVQYRNKISIWLQPNSDSLDVSMKRCYTLVMQHNFLRLGIQLHKIYNIK